MTYIMVDNTNCSLQSLCRMLGRLPDLVRSHAHQKDVEQPIKIG